ncbi:protein-ADP-ribose hydrolase, partial [Thermodesulfobacteriota bacterium]
SSYEEMRASLRGLLTVQSPARLPFWFHEQLDRLLSAEAYERGYTEASDLPRVSESVPGSSYGAADQCALWRGDITTLRVGAIVNAANKYLLGCFQPFHACIDNIIHSAAGPRVRDDCQDIMSLQLCVEGTGQAKITRAYNLPTEYRIHTVGPIVEGGNRGLGRQQEQQLSDCYRSCLDLSRRISGLRSVAFCCISTGVFGFPQEPAARIAIETVERWMDEHPGQLDLVVFNVFRHEDLRIYAGLLRGE